MRKSELTPSCRRLVELMQEVHYGEIRGLCVREGRPTFVPRPRIIRMEKLDAEEDPRPPAPAEDYVLKKQVQRLLEHLQRVRDGMIRRIQVKHGLPFSLEVETEPGQ